MADDQLAELGISDCLTQAGSRLQELLKETCELPLGQVANLAQDHGLKTHELLAQADLSDSCWVDYVTGHIRCVDVPDITPTPTPAPKPDPTPQDA